MAVKLIHRAGHEWPIDHITWSDSNRTTLVDCHCKMRDGRGEAGHVTVDLRHGWGGKRFEWRLDEATLEIMREAYRQKHRRKMRSMPDPYRKPRRTRPNRGPWVDPRQLSLK